MTDIIVTDNDEILKIVVDESEIKIEESIQQTVVEAQESEIVVKDLVSENIVIDLTNSYIVTSQQAPDIFIPTTGQTVFTLSVIPVGNELLTLRVYVNRLKLLFGSYSIVGSQLTITGLPFSLNPTFIVEVYY